MTHAANKATRKKRLIDALTEPMCYKTLAEKAGFSPQTTNVYLHEMKDDGLVYVAGVEKHSGCDTRLWMVSNGADVDAHEDEELEAKIFRRRDPVAVHIHRDPLVAALFGEVAHV